MTRYMDVKVSKVIVHCSYTCPAINDNYYDGSNTCPTFDVRAWAESLDI